MISNLNKYFSTEKFNIIKKLPPSRQSVHGPKTRRPIRIFADSGALIKTRFNDPEDLPELEPIPAWNSNKNIGNNVKFDANVQFKTGRRPASPDTYYPNPWTKIQRKTHKIMNTKNTSPKEGAIDSGTSSHFVPQDLETKTSTWSP